MKQENFAEKLFKNRIVIIMSDIGNEQSRNIIDDLLALSDESPDKPIQLFISCTSRNYTDVFAIYDVLLSLPNPLIGYCIGLTAAYGTLLLSACTKGKRYALKHSEIYLNQPLACAKARPQQTELVIEAKEASNQRKAYEEELAKNTGQTLEEIHRAVEEERQFSAEEAVAFGLIDKVI